MNRPTRDREEHRETPSARGARGRRGRAGPPTVRGRGRRRGWGQRGEGAFTLIELLVVISIIAVLISITIPALGNARETSRRVKCLVNLRSIGTGIDMYMTRESKRIFPRLAPLHGAPSGANDVSLLDLLADYLDAEVPRAEDPAATEKRYIVGDPYRCPSDMAGLGGNDSGEPSWRTIGTSYDYPPGLLMLVAESLFVSRPAFGVTKAYENGRETWPIVTDWGDWHKGRATIQRKNAVYFPDLRTDWSIDPPDAAEAAKVIQDIIRFGG